jgi:cytochrome c oxidase subunit 1
MPWSDADGRNRNGSLVNIHFWGWMIGTMMMTYSMGMAGVRGMLRRTLYDSALYEPYMTVAMIGGMLIAAAFVVFLINLIGSLGLRTVIGLFLPERGQRERIAAAAD